VALIRRPYILLGLLLFSAILVAAYLMLHSQSVPPLTAPISVTSQQWKLGQDANLIVSGHPDRFGQLVELVVFPPPQHEVKITGRSREYFGLAGVQLPWLPPEHRQIEMALAAATGAAFIGLDFDWRRIEPERGKFRWDETDEVVRLARKYNLRLVPMLLYTPRWASSAPYAPLDYHRAPPADLEDYRRFVFAVVDRYKPGGSSGLTTGEFGIRDWVIWNEPNVRPHGEDPLPGEFWTGSLEHYIQLLRVGYEAAHAADPGCNVLNAGLADVLWEPGRADLITSLNRFYDPNGDGDAADGGRAFFDTLNIHIYPLEHKDPYWLQQRLEDVFAIMDRFGDGKKRVWLTETGFGSVPASPFYRSNQQIPEPFLSEGGQARMVEMIYAALAGYHRLETIFWWSLRDYYHDGSATNPSMEAHYGLLRADFSPKPAYLAYAEMVGGERQPLHIEAEIGEDGLAQVLLPGTFIDRPGNFIIFSSLAVESGESLRYPHWTGVAEFTVTE
jgi:polysaccharide biosynthesis protein PslG